MKVFSLKTVCQDRFSKNLRIGLLTTCLTAAFAVKLQAADQGADFQYSHLTAPIESPAEESTAFWEHFKITFDERSEEVYVDNFRPFNSLNWRLRLADRDSQQLRERISDTARHALTKSVVDSFREAALELPFLLWLKDRRTLLSDFLLNSLGNIQEEAVSPLDLSDRAAERSWWQRLSASRTFNYGIRPFRTNPYAFLSKGFNDGDRVFLLANARYYYRSFAVHRFELALSVPLAHGFSFDVGTSYQFDQHDEQKGLVLKLFKQLRNGGIVHVGLEAKQNPVMFAGMTFPL